MASGLVKLFFRRVRLVEEVPGPDRRSQSRGSERERICGIWAVRAGHQEPCPGVCLRVWLEVLGVWEAWEASKG